MGAEVTKIEPPHGDFWRLTNSITPYESRGFIGVNKGKRSVSLDLKDPRSKDIVSRAVQYADVLIANYRPGVAERLGVDYATLSRINPRLIYCENTGFGTVGPYAGKAGYDLVTQAMTGIMAFEGAGGLPRPVITTSPTDLAAGMFMAYSVACALHQRNQTGKGQHIETSLFAAGLAIQYRPMLSIESEDAPLRAEYLEDVAAARAEGKAYEEYARRRPMAGASSQGTNPYYKVYEVKDGYFVVACLNNRLRRGVCEVLGVEDPRVAGNEFNMRALSPEDATVLNEHIASLMSHKTSAEWSELFDAKGVPCGPVRLTAELFNDEHVKANNLIVDLEHPIIGKIKMANSPVRMSGADTGSSRSSPALGQDSRAFLGELG
jgi:formyl-CoA transferase